MEKPHKKIIVKHESIDYPEPSFKKSPEPCIYGECDGSGWVEVGEHDDINMRRCLCNPYESVESQMDDDSDDDPIKFACHN